ncbi:Fic family protein [Allobacillus sp. GCM10007491]|uniref:Fic family protein n=1 Tax=Allobacillus saliphilus TaxID=2912308 RepID=A0A941HRG9_9BACI|nr:Fic family protein [Allobacillus saliphilus]MBR7552581.1 Fic family protein [Allobacillus saliphilus]
MNQSNIYELYFVPTHSMLSLVNEIHMISESFNMVFRELPIVAQRQFIDECLQEELYHTNDLEGVKSTKKEIAESIRHVRKKTLKNKRFASMVKSYLNILSGKTDLPRSPNDVRSVYDEIIQGEIEKGELPDGDFFRRDVTNVLKQSGSGKVIHQGITPENRIIEEIEHMLSFLNNENEIPLIIRTVIAHYFFGYIHPFYDGNGRTSRYISSMYLAKVLGDYAALSLSRGCNKERRNYLKAFEMTNSIKSSGELNYFIETLLTIIKNSLEDMYGELSEKFQLLQQAFGKIESDSKLVNMQDDYQNLMFILAQNHFFDSSPGLTVKELAEFVGKSEVTIRKRVGFLLEEELIDQQGQKPAFYFINKSYLEK